MLTTAATDYGGYRASVIRQAIAEAKWLGFSWGGDWKDGWDKPHLEFRYKGYGTDKVLDASKEPYIKKDEDKLKLTNSQKNISDKSWIEKAEKGTLNVSELTFLNTIILARKEAKWYE